MATPGAVSESHLGMQWDCSQSAHSVDLSLPPILPAKQSQVCQDCEEDASADVVITTDVAAYMQSSVPKFANNGHFHTSGPAPQLSQVPPAVLKNSLVSEVAPDNLYKLHCMPSACS